MVDDPRSVGGNAIEPELARATNMFREAAEAAEAVARQEASGSDLKRIGAVLRARSPHVVITCARGSSDHAATFAKYAIETRLRIPTASAAPSVASVYSSSASCRRCSVHRHIAIGPKPGSARHSREPQGCWRMGAGAGQRHAAPRCANMRTRFSRSTAGPERASPRPSPSSPRCRPSPASLRPGPRMRRWRRSCARSPTNWRRPGSSTGQRCPNALVHVAATFTYLAEASDWLPRRKLRSSSRKPRNCTPKRSAAAELSHGPMALVGEGFPILMFTQADETAAGDASGGYGAGSTWCTRVPRRAKMPRARFACRQSPAPRCSDRSFRSKASIAPPMRWRWLADSTRTDRRISPR